MKKVAGKRGGHGAGLRGAVVVMAMMLAGASYAAGDEAHEHMHAPMSSTHESAVSASEPALSAQDRGQARGQVPGQESAVMTDGEVRRLDLANGKLTLRHGDIRNLGMPAMTMVFRVADKTVLDGLRVGDKVRFHAESDNGQLVVTELRPAP